MGRDEERSCRFCQHALPRWGDALMPQAPAEVRQQATAVMAVCYNGVCHKVPVRPVRRNGDSAA